MSRSGFSELFRPTDEALSSRQKSQIQAHRLLFLIGTFLCLLFVRLYAVSSPNPVPHVWSWVTVSGLLASVFAASYLSETVRRRFAAWVRGTSYGIMGWFILLAAQNDFAGNYEIGLLLLHVIFTVIAGLGERSVRPLIWFTSASLLATVGTVLLEPIPLADEAVLLGALASVSLLVGIVIQRLISMREAVERQESRLRGLANSVPGVVLQLRERPDGSLGSAFVSEHAEEVLGLSAETEGFLDRVAERVPPPYREKIAELIEAAKEEREPWQFEVPFKKPSGEQIWLLGTATPEVRGGRVVFNGFLLDITERKRTERELREAKEEAEEASQVKTAMLANMSHEVRTPLTSIIGFSEILKDNLKGEMKRFAKQTHESSRRLSETLQSILQLSKLQAGVASPEREEVSITTVAQETVDLLQPQADEKAITIKTEWPDEGVRGIWNENATRRIIRNLLENAIKFTPETGRVVVRVRREDGQAVLEVEDTGIGISDELLPDVFQAFRQESEGIGREYQGSGLGLSIVDHLVEAHGGTIEVETEKGEGTCFTVTLPLTVEESAMGEATSPRSSVAEEASR